MSRPNPEPPLADHAQHDALLVAQYAARDPLDETQQRAAASLLASCAECVSLAADLGTVSGAVAWEPVPPRRRDFRLTAEQAEQARGSSLQRFVRRLALPETRRLRPVAAGVMSLGLVFVLAGNLWNDGVADVAQSQPASIPAGVESLDAVKAEDRITSDGLGIGDGPSAETGTSVAPSPAAAQAPPASTLFRAQEPKDDVVGDRDAPLTADEADSAPQELAQEQLGATEPELASSGADLAEGAARSELEVFGDDIAKNEAPDENSNAALERVDTRKAVAGTDATARPSAKRANVVERPVEIDGAVDTRSRDVVGQDGAALVTQAQPEATGETSVQEGVSGQAVLVAIGIVLALGGLLVLVVMWFARRRTDPLVR